MSSTRLSNVVAMPRPRVAPRLAAGSAGELRVEADLRNPGEGPRDGAVLLRGLCGLPEGVVVDAGHPALHGQRDLRDPLSRLEGDGRRGPELLGCMPLLREPMRERHREA